MQEKLNVNIPERISEFETIMRHFRVKNIIYKVLFRGKGLEFDSYRDFTQDDDASFIDWKASKRANKLLVRQYIEERDLKIFFVIDVGSNMVFGSTEKLKCEYATEVIAALSHLILISGDRVGFAFVGNEIKEFNYPKNDIRVHQVLTDSLIKPETYEEKVSNFPASLKFLLNYLDKSISAVFLISDFLNIDESCEKILTSFGSKFETIALIIRDPLDEELPEINEEIVIEDPVSGEQIGINPITIYSKYRNFMKERNEKLHSLFNRSGIDFLKLRTDTYFPPILASFLKERVERRKFILPRG